MRVFALYILLVLFLNHNSYAQENAQEFLFYKSFDDSVFHVGDQILCNHIIFTTTGRGQISEDSKFSAKQIADFLIKFPNIKIEIGVHTDTRGSEEANLKISLNRANGIKLYLEEHFSISSDRIVPKGYGESEPIHSEKYINQFKEVDKVKYEQLHQINRRVVLKILEV